LADGTALYRDCLRGCNNAASDESLPAFILAREDETGLQSAMLLPPYIVFCAVNVNDFAGSVSV
jgi:hypothetical protein